jgi:hypothetical protein
MIELVDRKVINQCHLSGSLLVDVFDLECLFK